MLVLLLATASNATTTFDEEHQSTTTTMLDWLLYVNGEPSYFYYFLVAFLFVTPLLFFFQLNPYARPPPVPKKRLPKRPAISILFKPDEFTSAPVARRATTATTTTTTAGSETLSSSAKWQNPLKSVTQKLFAKEGKSSNAPVAVETVAADDEDDDAASTSKWSVRSGLTPVHEEDGGTEASTTIEIPTIQLQDLPDSFAPLLSSSHVELARNQLTANLIHAVQVEGSVRIREGRHEIPLDKDASRPQLLLDVPKSGCRLSFMASVGSDGFSLEQDLDVNSKTTSRTWPMVKTAGVVLDPPLPLANVAPTLIHFPTLFEDKFVTHDLRRIQLIRIILDFVISISSFIEKVLWILESHCQIHLSKVRVTPVYKGRQPGDNTTAEWIPEWRLTLAFSGHVMLFGWIPVPFISFILPTFIIPQPHALLENLFTPEPLASARLRRENIAEQPIALAIINTAESWTMESKVVATPPAVGVDVTLPGGVAVALEMIYGKDPGAGENLTDLTMARTERSVADRSTKNKKMTSVAAAAAAAAAGDDQSVNSMSSWSTQPHSTASALGGGGSALGGGTAYSRGSRRTSFTASTLDVNDMVPWCIEVAAKGSVSREKMTFHLLKLLAKHEEMSITAPMMSKLGSRGSFAIWRPDHKKTHESSPSLVRKKAGAFGHLAALAADEETLSVASVLLFPKETIHPELRLLNYDYAFEVFDDTRLDSITLSTGATHPMLSGGTMVTTILESIYAYGSLSARENASLDPLDYLQKRNILRHLPAIDFTLGVQNIFIPSDSMSYSDDGKGVQFIPGMDGGRIMVRLLGGTEGTAKRLPEDDVLSNVSSDGGGGVAVDDPSLIPVSDGVKVVADVGFGNITLNNEADVDEFPELEIFEGTKLKALIHGMISGSLIVHLRPQKLKHGLGVSTGPNIFNPLEAYEIDFSGSSFSLKVKECHANLGHRRVIIPTETTVMVEILESIVDMTLEGMTQCELCWDFQGSSPILQVAELGQSPAEVGPESKRQVSFLIPPLRQGRFTLHVSSVGGIKIAKAATSREDKEGLYDWKFFNALVSPDETSADRMIQVANDKRSMEKLLQVAELVNSEVHKVMRFALNQIWKAKEVIEKEEIEDVKHIIPAYRMARLISLMVVDDLSETDNLHNIIMRVVDGDGLDVVKVKELMRQHIAAYDEWAPEIDRAIRWAALAFSPMVVDPPYVEGEVPPLCEMKHHARRLRNIPSAKELYDKIHDKPHLPLEPAFSNLLSRVAPYLTFHQIEYFLQIRKSKDWQSADLRRIRYVYSIKRRVLEIAESYGGLSFLPQSFLVSVFLGEATRASLRASGKVNRRRLSQSKKYARITLSTLRRRRSASRRMVLDEVTEADESREDFIVTPAGRVASYQDLASGGEPSIPGNVIVDKEKRKYNSDTDTPGSGGPPEHIDPLLGHQNDVYQPYELGDSLLGPQDVAILLQAGLTSAMKGSTVVQLNQRMLLDLMASQPKSFAVAVLAEIGTHGGQGSTRGLTSALMALLELDQTSFKPVYRLDMHALLETWLPELKIPKREDYMAGGRWARQSYYEAVYAVSKNIIEDAECYMALKSHIQSYRRHAESDPLQHPQEYADSSSVTTGLDLSLPEWDSTKMQEAVTRAKEAITNADTAGAKFVEERLLRDERVALESDSYKKVIQLYRDAFDACVRVRALDKLAFHFGWFRDFYKRNYDALMMKSMLDNVIDDVDDVRYWLQKMRVGTKRAEMVAKRTSNVGHHDEGFNFFGIQIGGENYEEMMESLKNDKLFLEPHRSRKQVLLDAIIEAMVYEPEDREKLKKDPLVRLLIPNLPGHYNFAVVTAMGVITEGKKGTELNTALQRLKEERGVLTIRADTGTARSLEYNASKIHEAIEVAVNMGVPYGIVGYSQGCANALVAESILLSGSPVQRQLLKSDKSGLVCRQLLFSAANGSVHGPAMDKKAQRLIVMFEEFFKYQQGYVSRALASTVLETLMSTMDSAPFQKVLGGAQSFLSEGCRAFWREAQHLPHVPTCTLRGVMEDHSTPECLEMLGSLLTKQSGSCLHDSQVHVYDAVGYPVYHNNRNGRLLRNCAIGDGVIQRSHHWSPLAEEVEWVRTVKDIEKASFDCAKDRHVYPWVDVNVRFGFIHYADEDSNWEETDTAISNFAPANTLHPSKLIKSRSSGSQADMNNN